MLATRSRRAKGVDFKILSADFDLRVLDFGEHIHFGEGRVATFGLIEGRNSHQTVSASLGSHHPIWLSAGEEEGG